MIQCNIIVSIMNKYHNNKLPNVEGTFSKIKLLVKGTYSDNKLLVKGTYSDNKLQVKGTYSDKCHLRWLRGLRRSHVHSLMIARRSLCPEKLGSNPGQGSKGINLSGWHGLYMSI